MFGGTVKNVACINPGSRRWTAETGGAGEWLWSGHVLVSPGEIHENIVGLDIEFERLQQAKIHAEHLVNAAGKTCP